MTILYVDDDADDREFFPDAIHEANPRADVVLVENGLKAMDYLYRIKDAHTTLPSLIILDINMPFLDGRETFQRIRTDLALRHIPIVVFSSSENPNDKVWFRNSGAEFITKPNNIVFMNEIVGRMLEQCS